MRPGVGRDFVGRADVIEDPSPRDRALQQRVIVKATADAVLFMADHQRSAGPSRFTGGDGPNAHQLAIEVRAKLAGR